MRPNPVLPSSIWSSSTRENHSFDSYFGGYCQAPAGSNPKCTDGPKCCEAAPAKDALTGSPSIRLDDHSNGSRDPNHERECETIEIDGGKMDRYVLATEKKTKGKCGDIRNFAVADAKSIAPYVKLAREGALADRYFQSLVGASSGNDMYFARAAFVFDDNDAIPDSAGSVCVGGPPGKIKTYEGKTIGDLLSDCAVDWSFYAEGYTIERDAEKNHTCPTPLPECRSHKKDYPCLFDPSDVPFQYYLSTRDDPRFMKDLAAFKADIVAKKLPPSALSRGWVSAPSTPATIFRSATARLSSEASSKKYSPPLYAEKTLILMTMDESGGFADHIAPPPTSKIDNQPYGARVPLFAIGPFARKGQISHVTLEHSSIVKFIEWNWLGGKTGQLGTRDTEVNNLGSLIDARRAGTQVPEGL